jgi:hypothetical protein
MVSSLFLIRCISISHFSQCKNGGWICHDQPLSSRTCSIVGLTHLETFDGSSLNVKPGHYLLVKVRYRLSNSTIFFGPVIKIICAWTQLFF